MALGNTNKPVKLTASTNRGSLTMGGVTKASASNVKVTNGQGPRQMTGSFPKLKRTSVGKSLDGIFSSVSDVKSKGAAHTGTNNPGGLKGVD